jgi:site-specific recombinase XerD
MSVGFFALFLGGIDDVTKVTADALRAFIIGLQQKERWTNHPYIKTKGKISGTSINTYVRSIKAFWSWLQKDGIIKKNPLEEVAAPKVPKRLPKVLSEEELTQVLKVASQKNRDRALIEILVDSGMRLNELANLNMEDVDEKDGVIRVIGKGDKQRNVFISDKTIATLNAYAIFARPEPVKEDRVFLTESGYPLTSRRIQKILDNIGKKAGIKQRLSPHKLRHSYATLSLKHGANLEYVRRTMGHSDIKVTEVYLDVCDADVAQAHRKFSPVANLK